MARGTPPAGLRGLVRTIEPLPFGIAAPWCAPPVFTERNGVVRPPRRSLSLQKPTRPVPSKKTAAMFALKLPCVGSESRKVPSIAGAWRTPCAPLRKTPPSRKPTLLAVRWWKTATRPVPIV